MKSYHFKQFVAASGETQRSTKFGGQPDWLTQSEWPLSKKTGNPMRFIAQISLDAEVFPGGEGKMAYIFITDEGEYVDGTWSPDAGENAVIIQPEGNNTKRVDNVSMGPTVSDAAFSVEAESVDEHELKPDDEFDSEDAYEEYCERYYESLSVDKIGGYPQFIQNEEFEILGDTRLLLQLNATGKLPFRINFGDMGRGYVEISGQCTNAYFYWDCY